MPRNCGPTFARRVGSSFLINGYAKNLLISLRQDLSLLAFFIDRHVNNFGFRDACPLTGLAIALRFDEHANGDRCYANLNGLRITTNQVADPNRLMKDYLAH